MACPQQNTRIMPPKTQHMLYKLPRQPRLPSKKRARFLLWQMAERKLCENLFAIVAVKCYNLEYMFYDSITAGKRKKP